MISNSNQQITYSTRYGINLLVDILLEYVGVFDDQRLQLYYSLNWYGLGVHREELGNYLNSFIGIIYLAFLGSVGSETTRQSKI